MGHHAGTQRCLDGGPEGREGQSGREGGLTAEAREVSCSSVEAC